MRFHVLYIYSRPQEINKEELEENSMRCGRKLAKDGEVSRSCDSSYTHTNCCTVGAKYTSVTVRTAVLPQRVF